MRHLRRHADAFAQRGVGVDGFADVHRVGAHLDGQRNLANHVARVGADHAAAQDLAVTMRLWAVVKQQLGHGLKAADGSGTAGCRLREQALFHLDALRSCLVFGQAHPGHFGVGVGSRSVQYQKSTL